MVSRVGEQKAETGYIGGVHVGSLWKRNEPGREVVRVERAWMYGHPVPEPTVRAHPTTGGRPLVAPTAWLREHYTEVNPAAAANQRGLSRSPLATADESSTPQQVCSDLNNTPDEPRPIHFGYLSECPNGLACDRHGCLDAHVSTRPGGEAS